MPQVSPRSEFSVHKRRVEVTLTMADGHSADGHLFLGDTTTAGDGPERVDDLLNGSTGFFPFERIDGGPRRIVLYNSSHVAVVTLAGHEAHEVPGYDVATIRRVALLLSTGEQVSGTIQLYLPHGRDRVSDWTRDPALFRYLETADATLLVNIRHVVEITELESK
jgi:hypothetical protein